MSNDCVIQDPMAIDEESDVQSIVYDNTVADRDRSTCRVMGGAIGLAIQGFDVADVFMEGDVLMRSGDRFKTAERTEKFWIRGRLMSEYAAVCELR